MQSHEGLDQNPFARTRFAMDKYGGIEGGGGEDGSVLGMGPGELVDGSRVAGEGGVGGVGVSRDVVDFDGAIGRTSRQLGPIIIQLSIVNHIIMLSININRLRLALIRFNDGG